MFKGCASLISHPLTPICNNLLFTGIFPDHLKISVVHCTLYKKGDKTSVSNYGAVSLLTTFSKVLKKVMHSSLGHYLRPIMYSFQNSLAPEMGLSIENAAFKLTDSVLKCVIKNTCWWNIMFGKSFCLYKSHNFINYVTILTCKEQQEVGSNPNRKSNYNHQIQP
jgi:hypothetical protein